MILYYLPGCNSAPPEVLRKHGLEHVIDTPDRTYTQCNGLEGPGVVTGHGVAQLLPDKQEWQKTAAGWWVGWPKGQRPTPDSLARDPQLPGHSVKLGDGQTWQIPMAMEISDELSLSCALPQGLKLTEGGWQLGDVLDQFRAFWKAAEAYADVLYRDKGDASNYTVSDIVDLSVLAISTNYRLGPHEISALSLLAMRDETLVQVARAAIDFPGLEKLQQKKSASGSPGG